MEFEDDSTDNFNGGFGPCDVLYKRFSNCMSFGGQLRQIHRTGEAQNCGDLITDYSRCLLAKSSQDKNKQKELFLASHMVKEKEDQHPVNDILIPKSRPSWE